MTLFVRDILHKYYSWYFKIVSNFTRPTAREITYNNFEISLVVFMPNITTNHAIIYTNYRSFWPDLCGQKRNVNGVNSKPSNDRQIWTDNRHKSLCFYRQPSKRYNLINYLLQLRNSSSQSSDIRCEFPSVRTKWTHCMTCI